MGARAEAALWAVLAFVLFVPSKGHVPTYDSSCVHGCCTPPHTHTTSQAFYLKTEPNDRGGLEVHLHNDKVPFDLGTTILDVDAVFRDEIDVSTVALRVGCGGCARADPHGVEPRELELQPPTFEPFTQTVYRSGWRGEPGEPEKQFDTALLAGCEHNHFTIRLDVFANASGTVYWSPVLGRGETFTPRELASFGLFIAMNHGSSWAELGWTLWVNALVAVLLVAGAKRFAFGLENEDSPIARARVMDSSGVVRWAYDPKEILLDVSVHFYVLALLEIITHFCISAGVPGLTFEAFEVLGFWVGVVLIGNVLPLAVVLLIWSYALADDRNSGLVRADVWAPVHIFVFALFVFTLGSGLFFGPVAALLAGVVRLRETEWLGRSLRSDAGIPPVRAAEGAEQVASAAA